MAGLGYGQTRPDPAAIQAEANQRNIQRRLHEAEQALAAKRALRFQSQQVLAEAQRNLWS